VVGVEHQDEGPEQQALGHAEGVPADLFGLLDGGGARVLGRHEAAGEEPRE